MSIFHVDYVHRHTFFPITTITLNDNDKWTTVREDAMTISVCHNPLYESPVSPLPHPLHTIFPWYTTFRRPPFEFFIRAESFLPIRQKYPSVFILPKLSHLFGHRFNLIKWTAAHLFVTESGVQLSLGELWDEVWSWAADGSIA